MLPCAVVPGGYCCHLSAKLGFVGVGKQLVFCRWRWLFAWLCSYGSVFETVPFCLVCVFMVMIVFCVGWYVFS